MVPEKLGQSISYMFTPHVVFGRANSHTTHTAPLAATSPRSLSANKLYFQISDLPHRCSSVHAQPLNSSGSCMNSGLLLLMLRLTGLSPPGPPAPESSLPLPYAHLDFALSLAYVVPELLVLIQHHTCPPPLAASSLVKARLLLSSFSSQRWHRQGVRSLLPRAPYTKPHYRPHPSYAPLSKKLVEPRSRADT